MESSAPALPPCRDRKCPDLKCPDEIPAPAEANPSLRLFRSLRRQCPAQPPSAAPASAGPVRPGRGHLDADQHAPLTLHRCPVVVPVRMLAGDAPVVVD